MDKLSDEDIKVLRCYVRRRNVWLVLAGAIFLGAIGVSYFRLASHFFSYDGKVLSENLMGVRSIPNNAYYSGAWIKARHYALMGVLSFGAALILLLMIIINRRDAGIYRRILSYIEEQGHQSGEDG